MSIQLIGGTSGVILDTTASKAAKATLYDAAGNPINSYLDVEGLYHLAVTANQDCEIDPLNSTTANITNGVTWSGSLVSTLNAAAIQVTVLTDRRTTVSCYQYNTVGSAGPVFESWSVPANFGSARTIQATGVYYKITVKNEGASPTTSVSIQTVIAAMIECLPRNLSSGGNLRVTTSAEWQDSNKTLGLYGISTFRTVGDTVATQNLLTIENPVGSTIVTAIRSLNFMTDSTVALTTVSPQIKTSRATGMPSGGTILSAVKYKTAYVGATSVIRGATASDGGAATPITATPGDTFWSQFLDRQPTAAGFVAHPAYLMVPDPGTDLRQLLLYPGEAAMVQSVGALPATTHIVLNVNWLEIQY